MVHLLTSSLSLLEREIGDSLDLLLVRVDLLEDVGQQLNQLRVLQARLLRPETAKDSYWRA